MHFIPNLLSALGRLLALLEHLLYNLLLFDEECSHNPVLDTVCAAGAAVGSLNGLCWARDGGILAGPERRDLEEC